MKFNNDSIIFIHIPRTAGSYIESALCKKYNYKIKWPIPDKEKLFGLLEFNKNHFFTLQHLTINEMIKYSFITKNIENQYIFTIVRHPYDRILSIYNNWFFQYNSLDFFLDTLKDLKIEDYSHNGIITERDDFNYKNMTHKIEDIQYFVIPQYYYIMNNDNYNVNIIKYEEMESLNEILELELHFTPLNNLGSDITNGLTDSQKDKIYNIYKIDFEQFNYSK
jgi:hypothetical protein